MILGVISKELRRLYTARLALDSGKDKLWLMDLWNMRSDYPRAAAARRGAENDARVVREQSGALPEARPAHEEQKRASTARAS